MYICKNDYTAVGQVIYTLMTPFCSHVDSVFSVSETSFKFAKSWPDAQGRWPDAGRMLAGCWPKFTMKTREMALAAARIKPLPLIFLLLLFCFFTACGPDYAVFTYILLTLTSGRFH
jgi:hypothetical protein